MTDSSSNIENPYAPPEASAATEPATDPVESACKCFRGMAWAGLLYPALSAIQLIDKTRRSETLKLLILQSVIMGLVAISSSGFQFGFDVISTEHTDWLAGRPLSEAQSSFQSSHFRPSWRCPTCPNIAELILQLRPDEWRFPKRTRSKHCDRTCLPRRTLAFEQTLYGPDVAGPGGERGRDLEQAESDIVT